MNQHEKLGYGHLGGTLLVVGLLMLTALFAGAGITDLVDSPNARHSFLDTGWERGLVDGRWLMFFIGAMLAYLTRLRLAFLTMQNRRVLRWIIPIEFLAIALLSVLAALGLSWNSVVR